MKDFVDLQETREKLEDLRDSYNKNGGLSEEEKNELLSIRKVILKGYSESGLRGNSQSWLDLKRIATALGSATTHKEGRGL